MNTLSGYAVTACSSILAAFLGLGLVPSTVRGAEPDAAKPYRGVVTGILLLAPDFSPVDGAPIIMQEVSSHLGRGTQVADSALLTFGLDGSLSVLVEKSVATAANGDELWIWSNLIANSFAPPPASFAYEGGYEIIGGTGRFEGASGTGAINGTAKVVADGVFALAFSHEFDGTIRYDASNRSARKRK